MQSYNILFVAVIATGIETLTHNILLAFSVGVIILLLFDKGIPKIPDFIPDKKVNYVVN